MLKLTRSCLLGALLMLAWGCSDSDKAVVGKESAKLGLSDDAAALLSYVPADTPYVVANVEPLPEDLMKSLEPRIDRVLKAYGAMLKSMFADMQAKHRDGAAKDDDMARAAAVMQELASAMSVQGLKDMGLAMNTRSALYGNGLLPVMRVEVADPKLLEATIAKFEDKAGQKMAVGKVGDQPFRYAGDESVQVILAVMDNQLVLAMLPSAASEEMLQTTLGLTPPQRSLAQSGALLELARAQGYVLTSVGYLDVRRVVDTFLEDQTGTNKELLALMEYDASSLTEDCRNEIKSAADTMPRMTVGYTHMDEHRFDGKLVMELRHDLAAGLQKIAAPVPGMDDMGGLVAVGFSFNLQAARDFMTQRLQAIEAQPYKCDLFADVQQSIAAAKAALDQPLPPVVYSIKGFSVALDSFDGLDMSGKAVPTSAELRGILAVDNAQALLQMGQMFSPQLAALPLKPDGNAVQLQPGTVPGITNPVFLAMTDSAIAFSMGDGLEAKLPGMLKATPPVYPPLMSMSYDASAYFDLMGTAMQAGAEGGSKSGPQPSAESVAEVTDALSEIMDRISMQVIVSDKGVEIAHTVTLP